MLRGPSFDFKPARVQYSSDCSQMPRLFVSGDPQFGLRLQGFVKLPCDSLTDFTNPSKSDDVATNCYNTFVKRSGVGMASSCANFLAPSVSVAGFGGPGFGTSGNKSFTLCLGHPVSKHSAP